MHQTLRKAHNMKTNEWIPFLLTIVASSSAFGLLRAAEHAPVGYTDTPMLPGGKWHVHDPDRPQPKVVTPGTLSTPETPAKPTYDVVFIAPRFKDGKLESPAHITVFHNGVLVQNHTEILGETGHKILAKYKPHGPQGPLRLQDHGNPIRYRNIWVRPLNISNE